MPLDDEADAELEAAGYLCAARGYGLLFWGLALGLLLLFWDATLDLRGSMRVPGFALGLVMLAAGLARLLRLDILTRRWRFWLELALGLTVIGIWNAPFAAWWRVRPFHPFYAANLAGLLFLGALLLPALYLAATEVESSGGRAGGIGRGLCAAGIFLMLAVPLLTILGMAVVLAWRYETSLVFEAVRLANKLPFWSPLFFVIPSLLTLLEIRQARNACRRRWLTARQGGAGLGAADN